MKIFDIREFGAIGDGKTMNTAAIQAAIDACAEAGGGRVLLSEGTYLTASIVLKSFVDFHIEATAVLLGSPNCEDYPHWKTKHMDDTLLPRRRASALIFAEECENVSITGLGAIDANGEAFVEIAPNPTQWKKYQRIHDNTPPRVVFFAGCRNLRLEDITIRNTPGGWAVFLHDCDDAAVTRIHIKANLEYPNNDGLHINCSRDITVSDCNITASDDALIVRANSSSLPENKVSERIAITNCNLISHCGAIRLGWLNDGIIRNCTFSDLTVTDSRNVVLVTLPWRGPDRIPDEGREESHIENISFDNIIADRLHSHPIRIKIDDHENTRVKKGVIRSIFFRGVHCRGAEWPSIEGRSDFPVENLSFSHCSFEKVPYDSSFGPLRFLPEECRVCEPCGKELFSHVKNLMLDETTFSDNFA